MAARSLDELATYIGSDMLTRRTLLADTIRFASGTTCTEPLLRWLGVPALGLQDTGTPTIHRITMSTVIAIEKANNDDDLLAYTGRAELAGNAALAWQDAAAHTPALAVNARQQAAAARPAVRAAATPAPAGCARQPNATRTC